MTTATRRRVGFGLVGVGSLFVVLGLVGYTIDDAQSTSPTTTTTAPTTPAATATSTAPATTTTSSTPVGSVTPAPTATDAATTTAPPPPTVPPEPLIQEFVAAYAAATESDDADFLYGTMHPRVIELGGEELCRAYVENEVVLIGGYELTGPVEGPVEVATGVTGYTAGVVFEFEGQTFTETAAFALVDGEVRWLTTCR